MLIDLSASERLDLHTHSNWSDGALDPHALVALAHERRVRLLALTDHDTTDGCALAASACASHGIAFLPGVELSAAWREREIHVIGLGVDPDSTALGAHCARVRATRRARIVAIAQRLTQAGLAGEALCAAALAANAPTRMHVARALVAAGHARSTEEAFERWLGRGARAWVPTEWPAVSEAVAVIRAASGQPVLAHPHRYRLSNGALRTLAGEFRDAGGTGAEVSLAGMGPAAADQCASLARRTGLAGSIGSDFHEPRIAWRPLGRFAKLPEQIVPITEHLQVR